MGPWTIKKQIGEGAFARVYDIESSSKGGEVDYPLVAKVIPLGSGKGKKLKETTRIANTLNYEKDLYNGVLLRFKYKAKTPFRGFFGDDKTLGVRYMVMERLGCDLTKFCTTIRGTPSVQDVATIGLQILEGMEDFHSKGFLFVDSKPQNFMLRNNDPRELVFVDFGCAERWVNFNGVGARPQSTRELVGTPEFASLSCHQGNLPTRKDDIESMCLVLLSLRSGGKLPWNVAKSEAQVKEMMTTADMGQLSAEVDLPEVGQILLLCRDLGLDDVPDYGAFKQLLEQLKRSKNSGKAVKATGRSLAAKRPAASLTSATINKGKRGASKTSSKPVKEEEEGGDDDHVGLKESPTKRGRKEGNTTPRATKIKATPVMVEEEDKDEDEDEDEVLEEGPVIVVKEGRNRGASYPIREGDGNALGRGTDMDFVLLDQFASDWHATIKLTMPSGSSRDAKVSIRDEKTTNGTKLNGEKILSGRFKAVKSGDSLKIGTTVLELRGF